MSTFMLKSPHGKILKLGKALMGILNVTPDSFYDGGRFFKKEDALRHAKKLIEDGADIIDIGGESTRPDAKPVSIQEELRRVIPVIKSIRKSKWGRKVWISVDTYKAEVARQAIEAGADMINDITALRGDPQMVKIIAEGNIPVIFMYSKDSKLPTTRKKVHYRDVVKTILKFFKERVNFAKKNGIKTSQIILDPGMGGFVSMAPQYSFEILRRLPELICSMSHQVVPVHQTRAKRVSFIKKNPLLEESPGLHGQTSSKFPILIGTSRKSFLQKGLTKAALDVKSPSFFSAWYALEQGASVVRAHEIADLKNFL